MSLVYCVVKISMFMIRRHELKGLSLFHIRKRTCSPALPNHRLLLINITL